MNGLTLYEEKLGLKKKTKKYFPFKSNSFHLPGHKLLQNKTRMTTFNGYRIRGNIDGENLSSTKVAFMDLIFFLVSSFIQ